MNKQKCPGNPSLLGWELWTVSGIHFSIPSPLQDISSPLHRGILFMEGRGAEGRRKVGAEAGDEEREGTCGASLPVAKTGRPFLEP